MRTKYHIIGAHSTNTEQEIRKAKRLFLENVKSSKFPKCENVQIAFADVNNVITAEYMNINNYSILGKEIIFN